MIPLIITIFCSEGDERLYSCPQDVTEETVYDKLVTSAPNIITLRQTIHASCLICFNFEIFLVWLVCCAIRDFVIVNIIVAADVTIDLQMAGDGCLLPE